jgi:hypothetical protein
MKTLLTEFKKEFQDRVFDILWRQWSALGVAGHGDVWRGSLIDPEALLLITCTVGRYDARMFDAMVEWMGINGRYINVQRLKRIMTSELFAGEQVVRAVAAITSDSVSAAKWSSMAKTGEAGEPPCPLFFLSHGKPMPVVQETDPIFREHGLLRTRYEARNVAQLFRPEPVSNLMLRLRAFLGVNARCEIIAYLLLHEKSSPGSLARDAYYFPLTISKAMAEMRDSGFLASRIQGRRRDHRLAPGIWSDLFVGHEQPRWIVWPRLFRAIEVLWMFFQDTAITQNDPLAQASITQTDALAQASALRRVLIKSVVDRSETSGLDYSFGDLSGYPGEELIPFFIDRITAMLDTLSEP